MLFRNDPKIFKIETNRNSFFFYIKKLTSKVMCELKKEQYDFKSVNFECKMVFLTQYGRKVDFTRLFFNRVYTDSIGVF